MVIVLLGFVIHDLRQALHGDGSLLNGHLHTDDHEYTEMESMEGDIEFKDVTFRYGNRTPALDHISFTIPQGKKVALVGSSGSGKSTITKLLLKYYEPESGTISVNGVDLDEYSNASVRRCISYVPQNVELFSKTIFENIRISRT